jgi:hypothetical protein
MDRSAFTKIKIHLHRIVELTMSDVLDEATLHRTAKYFMDSGRAETHADAMRLLGEFGLTIHVGEETVRSADHQAALLTLVNVARRTLLAGIDVVGLPDVMSLTPLAVRQSLPDAVRSLGGNVVASGRPGWPSALIGTVGTAGLSGTSWQLTWEGWRGGVVPARDGDRLSEQEAIALAPVLAAAVCAAEVFTHHAGDHLLAGRRPAGLSLWRPGVDWLAPDPSAPPLTYLPSRLWIIGLGNLGQAFAWLLATLPYGDRSQVQLLLQDFDLIANSNDSTSILSFTHDTARKKVRVVADWLEGRGFNTFLEERRFGPMTRRTDDEPGVALCGVDNANARAALDKAGFGLIVEAGLGAGPQSFRSISMHTFPASRTPEEIWLKQIGTAAENVENLPAYQNLKRKGMGACGLTRLASRTVGVPFVGVIAGCLVISELLRRLHGSAAIELVSVSAAALADVETVVSSACSPYAFGHVLAAGGAA